MDNNKSIIDYEENVIFLEIEETDEDIEFTEEEQREIDAHNNEFIAKEIEPAIMRTFDVCKCNMNEFMAKNEARRRLMNVPPQQYRPQIDSDDVAKYRFALIILTVHGKYTGINTIIRECKNCHKIEYWGSVEVFAKLIAEITVNFFNRKQEEDEIMDVMLEENEILGKDTIFEDLDTKEDSPADDGDLETEDLGETIPEKEESSESAEE